MTQIFTTFACVGCGTVHTRGTGFAIKQPDHPRCSDADKACQCQHEWVEAVDEDGELIEPAYDVCINCGEERD